MIFWSRQKKWWAGKAAPGIYILQPFHILARLWIWYKGSD